MAIPALAPLMLNDAERTLGQADVKAVIFNLRQGHNMSTTEEKLKQAIEDANATLADALPKAVDNLIKLANDVTIDPKHQLKAITTILERVMGKSPERIEIHKSTARWQKALTVGIVGDDSDIINAEIIDEEDESPAAVIETLPKKKTSKKKKKKKKVE